MSSDRAHTVIMHLTTIHHKSIPLDNLPGVNLVNLLILRKGRVLIVAKHPGPLRGKPPVRSPIPCRAAKHTRATQHATGMPHRSACDGNVWGDRPPSLAGTSRFAIRCISGGAVCHKEMASQAATLVLDRVRTRLLGRRHGPAYIELYGILLVTLWTHRQNKSLDWQCMIWQCRAETCLRSRHRFSRRP